MMGWNLECVGVENEDSTNSLTSNTHCKRGPSLGTWSIVGGLLLRRHNSPRAYLGQKCPIVIICGIIPPSRPANSRKIGADGVGEAFRRTFGINRLIHRQEGLDLGDK